MPAVHVAQSAVQPVSAAVTDTVDLTELQSLLKMQLLVLVQEEKIQLAAAPPQAIVSAMTSMPAAQPVLLGFVVGVSAACLSCCGTYSSLD